MVRLIRDLKTAKKNLESFKIKIGMSYQFVCASCGAVWGRSKLGGAYNYEPPPALSSRMIAPAAYAVCAKCKDTLSQKKIYQNVTQTLAKEGLFG